MAEYIEREAVLAEIENEYKNAEKIKTPFAKIIVEGTAEKPYYSIMWWDTEKEEGYIGYSSYCLDYVFKWFEMVFEVGSADVAPVVHGRWREKCVAGFNKAFSTVFVCSKCEKSYRVPNMNYCPNCGAKMDGERRKE